MQPDFRLTTTIAHGSGAVGDSRGQPEVRLHVDIGGGTSKLALIADGAVLGAAVVAVGGRLVALDGRRVVRIEGPALRIAETEGIPLVLEEELSEEDERRLARAFVDILVGCIERSCMLAGYPASIQLRSMQPTRMSTKARASRRSSSSLSSSSSTRGIPSVSAIRRAGPSMRTTRRPSRATSRPPTATTAAPRTAPSAISASLDVPPPMSTCSLTSG